VNVGQFLRGYMAQYPIRLYLHTCCRENLKSYLLALVLRKRSYRPDLGSKAARGRPGLSQSVEVIRGDYNCEQNILG
jgi:hypothetical protein